MTRWLASAASGSPYLSTTSRTPAMFASRYRSSSSSLSSGNVFTSKPS